MGLFSKLKEKTEAIVKERMAERSEEREVAKAAFRKGRLSAVKTRAETEAKESVFRGGMFRRPVETVRAGKRTSYKMGDRSTYIGLSPSMFEAPSRAPRVRQARPEPGPMPMGFGGPQKKKRQFEPVRLM